MTPDQSVGQLVNRQNVAAYGYGYGQGLTNQHVEFNPGYSTQSYANQSYDQAGQLNQNVPPLAHADSPALPIKDKDDGKTSESQHKDDHSKDHHSKMDNDDDEFGDDDDDDDDDDEVTDDENNATSRDEIGRNDDDDDSERYAKPEEANQICSYLMKTGTDAEKNPAKKSASLVPGDSQSESSNFGIT